MLTVISEISTIGIAARFTGKYLPSETRDKGGTSSGGKEKNPMKIAVTTPAATSAINSPTLCLAKIKKRAVSKSRGKETTLFAMADADAATLPPGVFFPSPR
jgi:hypothetical protein